MDEKIEILLNSKKNINAVNVDTFDKIEITNNVSKITEYSIDNILSATEIFDAEREANKTYRIYGKIEWMSLLNGFDKATLFSNPLEDYFTPTIDGLNISSAFHFYLVKPSSDGYIPYKLESDLVSGEYIREFEVIATPDMFDLYPAGFSNNVFGEQAYAFNFNIDFDVSTFYDNFNFPVTDLFLFPVFKQNNGNVEYTYWDTALQQETKKNYTSVNYNIGDKVYGDLIYYNKNQFIQSGVTEQTFYIKTSYREPDYSIKYLEWKYDPFIPFKLRYLSDDLYNANTGDTTYDLVEAIPNYATKIDDNGNYVWRTILPQGYIDPLTGIGVDYPFMNKKRYLFSSIVFDTTPNLDDENTENVFNEIWFTDNAKTIDITPINNLDDIGAPCQ